jgi:hypothetical protein
VEHGFLPVKLLVMLGAISEKTFLGDDFIIYDPHSPSQDFTREFPITVTMILDRGTLELEGESFGNYI